VDNNRVVAANIPHDWSKWKYLHSGPIPRPPTRPPSRSAISSEPEQPQTITDGDCGGLDRRRLFEIAQKSLPPTTNPVGWNKIDYQDRLDRLEPLPAFHRSLFDAMTLSNVRRPAAGGGTAEINIPT
jgi:hypothetical protein